MAVKLIGETGWRVPRITSVSLFVQEQVEAEEPGSKLFLLTRLLSNLELNRTEDKSSTCLLASFSRDFCVAARFLRILPIRSNRDWAELKLCWDKISQSKFHLEKEVVITTFLLFILCWNQIDRFQTIFYSSSFFFHRMINNNLKINDLLIHIKHVWACLF